MDWEKTQHNTPDQRTEGEGIPRDSVPEGGEKRDRGPGDPEQVHNSPGAPPYKPATTAAKNTRKKAPRAAGNGSGGNGFVERPASSFTPAQKLLILDVWEHSNLSVKDFADILGVHPKTLSAWKKRYDELGPEGLFGLPRGPKPGSKVPPLTRQTILVMKERHPDLGCESISQILYRTPGLGVSASTVARVLKEEGYEAEEMPGNRHPDKQRRFERASPNQLWQSDIFTFTFKRKSHRLHLVAFMDDYSRYIVGTNLASSATGTFVIEALRTAIGNHGLPEEVLTDRGPQYHTWRGKSAFVKEVRKLGIKHILSRPRHPETLGKVERFWKTLWKEFLEDAVFSDINEARERIGHYVAHYNFQRPHQGIEGLVPADRFFGAADEVRATLEKRVAENALQIAQHGTTAEPFYLTGRVGDQGVSVHAQGERLILTREDGSQGEVSFDKPSSPPEQPEQKAPVEVSEDDSSEALTAEEVGHGQEG